MGEEFPLDPNQVQPPQEGEATHIDVTSHEGDAQLGEVALYSEPQEQGTHSDEELFDTQPPHLDKIDHDESKDERWDNDKARAIADAVREEENRTGSVGIGMKLYGQEQAIKADNLPGPERKIVAGRWARMGKSFEVSQERKDAIINEAREAMSKTDDEGEKAHHYITAEMRLRGEEISQRFNGAAETFEELYDSDPERFATMPAREFMYIGDSLKRTKQDLEVLNEQEKPLRELAYTLDSARSINAMSGERLVAIDMKPEADDALADLIVESLGQKPEDKEAIKEALGKLREGDKSPDDLQADQARLIADYYHQAQGRKDAYAERLYKMFKGHHLPDSVRGLLYPAPPEVPASFIGRPINRKAEEQSE